ASKLKACPTLPGAKVTPFTSVPLLLLPELSFASPSADQWPTGAHGAVGTCIAASMGGFAVVGRTDARDRIHEMPGRAMPLSRRVKISARRALRLLRGLECLMAITPVSWPWHACKGKLIG